MDDADCFPSVFPIRLFPSLMTILRLHLKALTSADDPVTLGKAETIRQEPFLITPLID